MGLDMNFYKVNGNGQQEHLHYFRKHSDLHGVLQDCWLEKNPGKGAEEFNCIDFEITLEEVMRVIDFMSNRHTNKHYKGFFWGQSTEEDWEETIVALKEILMALEAGEKVIYVCWW